MKISELLIASLKGIGQVIFIDKALTGFLFLCGIAFYSPIVAVVAFLSSMLAIIVGLLTKANAEQLVQGLYSFSAVLTGMALTLFLTGPYTIIVALLGALVTTIMAAAMHHLMKNSGIPVLTFPFIIVTWSILLASNGLKGIEVAQAAPVTQNVKVDFSAALFNGIGQIFFLPSTISAIFILLGLFWGGWRYGVYAMTSALVALGTAMLSSADYTAINLGLYGYNSILAMIAIGLVFQEHARFALISSLFAASCAVVLTASISALVAPFALPTLTMPFVLITWLFLAARKQMPAL